MRQRSAEDGDRPVERHDDGDHAQRLVGHRGCHRDGTGNRGQHFRRVDFVGVVQRQLPAQLEHQRIDPGFKADLAVLLRQDRRIVIAVLGNAAECRQHPLGTLLRRQGGPGRVCGLRAGDGITDILRRSRGAKADDYARLGGIGNRYLVRGLPFLAPDVQRSGHWL